jgi:hypothetical protein
MTGRSDRSRSASLSLPNGGPKVASWRAESSATCSARERTAHERGEARREHEGGALVIADAAARARAECKRTPLARGRIAASLPALAGARARARQPWSRRRRRAHPLGLARELPTLRRCSEAAVRRWYLLIDRRPSGRSRCGAVRMVGRGCAVRGAADVHVCRWSRRTMLRLRHRVL